MNKSKFRRIEAKLRAMTTCHEANRAVQDHAAQGVVYNRVRISPTVIRKRATK